MLLWRQHLSQSAGIHEIKEPESLIIIIIIIIIIMLTFIMRLLLQT